MYKRITIILAAAGMLFALWVVATAKEKTPNPPPAYPPSINPFGRGIVALGVVESASRDVEIAAPEAGRVEAVAVAVGQKVKAGDPLFSLDTTALEAEMLRAVAARDSAAAELARQKAWPRPEDIPPLEAAVNEARARLDDAADRLRSLQDAQEQSAATHDEVSRQKFLVQTNRAALAQAQANLDKYRAGAWTQDVRVAEANLAQAEANVRALQKQIERLHVRSPIDATVLKRNVEPGEYASVGGGGMGSSNSASTAAMVLGDLSSLRVRAQVDEEDMPLLRAGAMAKARVRGPLSRERGELDLKMLWIEPLAGPKRQITNASTELVDTRVVEVIFELRPEDQKGVTLYPGQVVDVYIDAPEAHNSDEPKPDSPKSEAAEGSRSSK
jgi:multidrug efflux pump subunit AcrA (membrane-fusion protein)